MPSRTFRRDRSSSILDAVKRDQERLRQAREAQERADRLYRHSVEPAQDDGAEDREYEEAARQARHEREK